MRFTTYLRDGAPRLAVVDGRTGNDLAIDIAADLRAELARGADLPAAGRAAIASNAPRLPLAGLELAPLVPEPGKIVCLGLNYFDHAKEGGRDKPEYPWFFLRGKSSLVGHGQPGWVPKASAKFDYEAELAVVIGSTVPRHVKREDALRHVFGYSCFNDMSVRDFQKRTPQWTIGKNFDATGGFGPLLVTADELAPGATGLRIQSRLNGQLMQDANTSDMIFAVDETIALLAECMTLEPGDVIVMGTPAGVGQARTPQVWMKAGDVIEIEIDGIGTLVNPLVAEGRLMADVDCDVAVVGYGPAGAVAAALLGQAGFRVHVCDRQREVYAIPRAIAIDHEVMRVFQQLGIVDAVRGHTEPFTPSEYFGVDGQLIRRMTMVAPPYPQGHVPSIVFTQPAVERVLREAVAALPNVTVALGSELTALTQDADGATLGLQGDDGGRTTLRARWVIGCDGGSSAVRAMAGIALEDLDFDEPWLVVDALVGESGLAKLPATSVQYCEPARPCSFIIGPGNHRRWEISLNSGEDPRAAATPEGTWRLLERWLTPADATLWRQSSYRFHALVAESWRAGRVFVAGDAAHMQPPFLGQGMCQGVRDVTNLAWKLGAVLRGEVSGPAAETLLDSYGVERKAHVRELTRRIKAVGAVICERDVAKARERDARMLAECGGVVQDTPRQDILPRLEEGLLSRAAGSARGTLFPQPLLAGGGLLDERFGRGWRLVLAAGGEVPALLPAGLTSIDLAQHPEAQGVVAAWMARHGCMAALVRPDHYVFGTASTATDTAALITEWQQALP